MKLFCRCTKPWLVAHTGMKPYSNETRQILSDIPVGSCCFTVWYWYDADYENMMFDLRSMNTIW